MMEARVEHLNVWKVARNRIYHLDERDAETEQERAVSRLYPSAYAFEAEPLLCQLEDYVQAVAELAAERVAYLLLGFGPALRGYGPELRGAIRSGLDPEVDQDEEWTIAVRKTDAYRVVTSRMGDGDRALSVKVYGLEWCPRRRIRTPITCMFDGVELAGVKESHELVGTWSAIVSSGNLFYRQGFKLDVTPEWLPFVLPAELGAALGPYVARDDSA